MSDADDTICFQSEIFGQLWAQFSFYIEYDNSWCVTNIELFADKECTNLLADDIHMEDFTAEQQKTLYAELEAAEKARREHYTKRLPVHADVAAVVDGAFDRMFRS